MLIKETPGSKGEQTGTTKFDFGGLVVFIITKLALNFVITRGGKFGWTRHNYFKSQYFN